MSFANRLHRWLFGRLLMRFTSLRLAFLLTRGGIKPFYLMRDLILALDAVLSYGIRLIVLAAFLRLIFFRRIHAPLVNESLIALLVLAYLLLKFEKKERERKERFTRFWIEDINIGSARILKGNVVTGHLFLNNLQHEWDENSLKQAWENVTTATTWLERQAFLYNVQLKIANSLLDGVKITFDHPIPTHDNDFQFWKEFEGVLSEAYRRLAESAAQSLRQGESYCLMLHVLEDITSYAMPEFIGMGKGGKTVEFCVCAKRIGSAGYAHEILHLFGADDYYWAYSKKYHDYKKEMVGGSIMFSAESLDGVRVDELTAQNIGWL